MDTKELQRMERLDCMKTKQHFHLLFLWKMIWKMSEMNHIIVSHTKMKFTEIFPIK